jgi:hypothetical protein
MIEIKIILPNEKSFVCNIQVIHDGNKQSF